MGWVNTLAKKFPKMTQRRVMILFSMLILGAVITFRGCSIKTKWFSCDSPSNVKIEKGKDDGR